MNESNLTQSKPKIWTKDFILVFVSNLLVAFAFYILMPTLPFYLTDTLKLPMTEIGLYLSLYVLAVLATRPFSGYFTDKFPRKTFYVIMVALFSVIFGFYLISATLLCFAIVRIMQGVSWSMSSTSGSTLAIDILPSQRRGEGIGYYGLSMTLAMALGPMVGLFLYDNFHFDYIFITALGASLVGFIISLFIKSTPKPIVEKSAISLDRFFLVKALPEVLVLTLITISYGFAVSYVAMFGKHIGVENTGLFFIFMSLGTIISRFTVGKWIDKGHEISIIISSLILLIVVIAGFSVCYNTALFYVLGFLSGVGFGVMSPAFQTLILNIAPHNRRGTANSTYFTGFDLGIGVGIFVGSTLISSIGYNGMYAVGTIINIIATLLFIFYVKNHYKKNKLK